ncbi:carbohydrate ABC transporter permease [Frankia sp. CNm7]|uniref:Carbohydrate ABC transporter permease n=1 Tax=Frankia nepalensis TaxID=1836974 RepID=A0A937RKD4_9ACTN|nr:carbohydrate ABC transporter permease [Frankia nepalensis]MBL7497285.1 carbohydrate ABC transporter permease [Frankia nepalensis]MBL7515472.1 carbohydrate ABC transporter permease [Frankia nepalensis]MBL7519930.1 carbohydrate ABC transporter permease [Frankia nepalensis]MBL7631910.1 carbohydrate ABC transporter permease [Frankia nepalensis]
MSVAIEKSPGPAAAGPPAGSDGSDGPGGRRRKRTGRSPDTERTGLLRYPFIIIVLLFSAFPVYWTFLIPSRTNAEVSQVPPPFIPGGHFFENVRRVFDTVDFGKALLNSFLVAGSITFTTLLFCSLAGFAFAKLQFRGRGALLLLVIGTMMVPVQLGIIPLYIEMQQFGWTNHLISVIVPTAVTAFGVVFMRQYAMQAVPDELLEAGRMDGCSTIGLYWHVVLPALRPAMAVLGLLTFMQAWNDFMWPLIALNPQNPTVQVALSTLSSGFYRDNTLVLAGTAIGTLPVLIIFAIFGRQIISGIMEGAVKG